MRSITDVLILTLSAFLSLLSIGKLYNFTKSWVVALVESDYGENWVPMVLFFWFLMLAVFLFSGSAYMLRKLEIILNGKLARMIRMN